MSPLDLLLITGNPTVLFYETIRLTAQVGKYSLPYLLHGVGFDSYTLKSSYYIISIHIQNVSKLVFHIQNLAMLAIHIQPSWLFVYK